MMEWEIRSKLYHMNFKEHGDDLREETIIEEWDPEIIAERARCYWKKQTKELYYPAKSYAIAVTYAFLLQKHFGGCVQDYLKSPNLLVGDPYFKPFCDDNYRIYNEIIPTYYMALKDTDKHCENFKLTIQFFEKEFLLHESTRHLIPPQ